MMSLIHPVAIAWDSGGVRRFLKVLLGSDFQVPDFVSLFFFSLAKILSSVLVERMAMAVEE